MSEIKIFLCLLTILISFCKLFTHVFFFLAWFPIWLLVTFNQFLRILCITDIILWLRYMLWIYPSTVIRLLALHMVIFFFLCKRFFSTELSSSLLTFIAFPLCHSWKAFPYTKVKKNSAVFTYNVFEFLHLRIWFIWSWFLHIVWGVDLILSFPKWLPRFFSAIYQKVCLGSGDSKCYLYYILNFHT